MDQQPKIPTLKDAQKPQVKIKGMGAGLTLFDRLKQFKKKDLAFILAGLGTLFMAPLAEHFMMAPENGDASLQQGWGKGGSGGGNFFGGGSSPYEGGGMAPGGAIGGSGDIITPLNVRDPSSLVMGPGGTQQPPAGSAAPAAPPPTAPASTETDYRDALKGAASRAASAAVKKSPLPVPKVALGGSGLRGLGVASGGSSASGGSLPVGPAAGSVGGGGGGGMRQVRATPGFKGVAGARSPTGGTGLDNTRKAGANAGDAFNRPGSAAAGLNAAANEQIPTGGQGFGGSGQGGAGANDKPGSGTGPGGSKSVGESLAFLRAKQRQEEELKLEFEKKRLNDFGLVWGGIRNDMAKGFGTELGKVLTKHALAPLSKEFWAGASDTVSGFKCAADGFTEFFPDSSPSVCMTTDAKMGTPDDKGGCKAIVPFVKCIKTTQAGAGAPAAPRAEGDIPNTPSEPVVGGAIVTSPAASAVDTLCKTLDTMITALKTPAEDGSVAAGGTDSVTHYETMRVKAGELLKARNSLAGGKPDGSCGVVEKLDVKHQHQLIAQHLADTRPELGAVPRLKDIVAKTKEQGEGPLGSASAKIANVATLLTDAQENLTIGKTALTNGIGAYAFTLAPIDATNDSLKPLGNTLNNANALKTELQSYAEGDGTTRQADLVKAHTDADATAKGTAVAILKTNTEFDKMKQAMPGVTIPDIEAPPAGGAPPAAPAVKTYAEVQAAVTKADAAILKACPAPCTPAPAPAAGAAPVTPTEPSTEVQEATTAVKELREAQRGYLGAIQKVVDPTGAAVPVPPTDVAAVEE